MLFNLGTVFSSFICCEAKSRILKVSGYSLQGHMIQHKLSFKRVRMPENLSIIIAHSTIFSAIPVFLIKKPQFQWFWHGPPVNQGVWVCVNFEDFVMLKNLYTFNWSILQGVYPKFN